MKLIILGSLSAYRGDPLASGTVVSLRLLIAELRERGLEPIVIDTACLRRRALLMPFAVLLTSFKLYRASRRADTITLHLSPNGLSVLGPIAVLIAKLTKRHLLIRLFGGLDYLEISKVRRILAAFAFSRANCALLQTKGLVEAGRKRGLRKVEWFPTSRPMPPEGAPNPYIPDPKRFIFVGQIKRRKGILHLIEATKRLGDRCRTDVYGPFYDDLDAGIFAEVPNIQYHGTLKPEDVCDELRHSAALVFPTFLEEEGYSGILMEAFSVGLPVICTRWKFLPEFVAPECAIFCEPDDVDSLEAAMRRFLDHPEWHPKMSEAAFANRRRFSVKRAADDFVRVCREIARNVS